MKQKYLLLLPITYMAVVIGFFSYNEDSWRKKYKEKQEEFYNTTIDGQVFGVSESHGATSFTLLYDFDKRYTCVVQDEPLANRETEFTHLLKYGACMLKPAKSDTIILMLDGKLHKYSFRKPEF